MKTNKKLFNYAKKRGFDITSNLSLEILNSLEKLIDRSKRNWFIIGEKIDNNNNPIFLLADNKGNLGHCYIASGSGFVTYSSIDDWVSWC